MQRRGPCQRSEQRHADADEQCADNRKHTVFADSADHTSAHNRHDEHAAHYRNICMPASDGVEFFTTCRYIGRNVTEPNSDMPTMNPIALPQQESALPEEFERQDRLDRVALFVNEAGNAYQAEREREPQLHRRPRQQRATLAREQNDAGERASEKRGAHVIDCVLHVRGARLEYHADHGERRNAERHVDVEDPAPRQMVDDKAAQ